MYLNYFINILNVNLTFVRHNICLL